MRIAAWSGPRNLSTAMMYAFAARGDCAVWDEPYYAAYLARTGIDHPMAAEIVAAYETDPARLARACAAAPPDAARHVYQKHMAQHMLPGFDLGWMAGAAHLFLIRHPARVIASYHAKRENPALADIGVARQAELYDAAEAATGQAPLVIDSDDIRRAPEPALRAMCAALGIEFRAGMLRWPRGGRREDGLWAGHWYGAVHDSEGFAGPEGPLPQVPAHLRDVLEAALPAYERLRAHRTAPDGTEAR